MRCLRPNWKAASVVEGGCFSLLRGWYPCGKADVTSSYRISRSFKANLRSKSGYKQSSSALCSCARGARTPTIRKVSISVFASFALLSN